MKRTMESMEYGVSQCQLLQTIQILWLLLLLLVLLVLGPAKTPDSYDSMIYSSQVAINMYVSLGSWVTQWLIGYLCYNFATCWHKRSYMSTSTQNVLPIIESCCFCFDIWFLWKVPNLILSWCWICRRQRQVIKRSIRKDILQFRKHLVDLHHSEDLRPCSRPGWDVSALKTKCWLHNKCKASFVCFAFRCNPCKFHSIIDLTSLVNLTANHVKEAQQFLGSQTKTFQNVVLVRIRKSLQHCLVKAETQRLQIVATIVLCLYSLQKVSWITCDCHCALMWLFLKS